MFLILYFLVIPALCGLGVIGFVWQRPSVRTVIPPPARSLAAVVFCVLFAFFVADGLSGANVARLLEMGNTLLVSCWLGLALALGAAGYTLVLGYIYGDARRRGMRPVLWTLIALFVSNMVGVLAYFLLRQPILQYCSRCGGAVPPSAAYCPHCGLPQAEALAV
jgi:hypothetical protein